MRSLRRSGWSVVDAVERPSAFKISSKHGMLCNIDFAAYGPLQFPPPKTQFSTHARLGALIYADHSPSDQCETVSLLLTYEKRSCPPLPSNRGLVLVSDALDHLHGAVWQPRTPEPSLAWRLALPKWLTRAQYSAWPRAALSTFLWWDYGYGTLGKVLWNEVCVAHVAMRELRV
jgi:hypothetical protein